MIGSDSGSGSGDSQIKRASLAHLRLPRIGVGVVSDPFHEVEGAFLVAFTLHLDPHRRPGEGFALPHDACFGVWALAPWALHLFGDDCFDLIRGLRGGGGRILACCRGRRLLAQAVFETGVTWTRNLNPHWGSQPGP